MVVFLVCFVLLLLVVVLSDGDGVWVGFEVEDFEGCRWGVGDLLGCVVLFDFWVIWCVLCFEEFLNLCRIYEKFEGVMIFGVSVD